MKTVKISLSLFCLLLCALCCQGCDSNGGSSEAPMSSRDLTTSTGSSEMRSFDPDKMPNLADIPKYTESFTISEPKRSSVTDMSEGTVTCSPAKKLPVTVYLDGFEVVNNTSRWIFHIVNESSKTWAGGVRIYLMSKGLPVDHKDWQPDKPMESGEGAYLAMDSSQAPPALKGNVDRYGWAYSTSQSDSNEKESDSASLRR